MARRAGLGRRGRPPLDVLVRLNPEVTPETIAGLAVGDGASKFGMTETEATGLVEWLATHADGAIRPRGVHLHVGSQLRAVDAWRDAVRRGLAVVGLLRGNLDTFDTLDVGGGFPVLPEDEPVPARSGSPASCRTSWRACPRDRRPARLAIEPGRALVARSGWLVARVLHVRDRGGRQVVIDAGMTELIRPALYGARHPIVALTSLGRPLDPDARRRIDDERADARRGPHLRVDRRPGHARPAAAPSRRPRGHQRRRRVRRLARLDLQRPARGRPGLPRRRTGPCGSLVAPVPDGDRYPACDATPRRPAAAPHPRADAGRRRQRGVALTAPGRAAVPGSGRRPGRLRLRRRLPAVDGRPGRGDRRRHRGPDEGRDRGLHAGHRAR